MTLFHVLYTLSKLFCKMLYFPSAVISTVSSHFNSLEWQIPIDVWVNFWKLVCELLVDVCLICPLLSDSLSTCPLSSVSKPCLFESIASAFLVVTSSACTRACEERISVLEWQSGKQQCTTVQNWIQILICTVFAKCDKSFSKYTFCQGERK